MGHALFRGAADADMLQKIAETIGSAGGGGGDRVGGEGGGAGALPDDMARVWSVAAMDGGGAHFALIF